MGREGPATVETTKQGRYEVLWRTLIQDKDQDRRHHPASSEGGQALISRFRTHLTAQYGLIFLGETINLLKDVRQEESEGGGRSGRFFTQAAGLLEEYETFRRLATAKVPGSDNGYDRERDMAALFETHAVLEMLQGRLSFKSEERPAPAFWARHVRMWRNMWAARVAEDHEALRHEIEQAWEFWASFEASPDHWTGSDGYQSNQVLFATSGRRLGLTSGGVEPGDEVWILPGLNVPVVLRSMGDGWSSLVGVAYFHGIMHGEGVPESRHVVGIDLV